MLAIDLDYSAELREPAFHRPEEVLHLKLNRRVRRIEFENLIRASSGSTDSQRETNREKQTKRFHIQGFYNHPRVGKGLKVTPALPSRQESAKPGSGEPARENFRSFQTAVGGDLEIALP